MWGFQRHFQISLQHRAEDLFKALNPEFEVETFLLGILREQKADRHPICLEPEDCGFNPSDFSSVMKDAEHYRAVDPERDVICSHEAHQRSFVRRIQHRSLRRAVLDQLRGWRSRKQGEYFFSGFMPVAEYDVGLVLRLHYKGEQDPYSLPKVHAEERFRPRYSLLDAAVEEFFIDFRSALNKPNPEYVDDLDERNAGELLRKAGDRLMDTPAWATGKIESLYGLFNACNVISSLTYESAESSGTILVARAGHPSIKPTLQLVNPVRLYRHRAVRKLLEVAATGDSLLFDGEGIVGFGRIIGNYNQAEADLFEIRFTRHYTWELLHGGHRMMLVSYGNPRLPLQPLNATKLASDLKRIFRGISTENAKELVDLALQACKQRHGALLVIASDAEQEARRLSNQATAIEPMALTPDIVKNVTAIDGAVLLNPQGVCFAIGAILDGLATPEGDPARGARYNSSLRYLANKAECLAIIVSEDGTAEWIPNLQPQIQRKELDAIQNEITELLKQAEVDWDRGHKALRWLRANQFYLSEKMCCEANELTKRINERRWKESSFMVHDTPFAANPAMNDEYVID